MTDQGLFKADLVLVAGWLNSNSFEELATVSCDERKELALLS